MRPAVENIGVVAGDDLSFIVEAVLTAYAPLTASDWAAAAVWRATQDGTPILTFTDSITVIDDDIYGTDSVLRVELSLTGSQTAGITRPGIWDLRVTYPAATTYTWVRGILAPA